MDIITKVESVIFQTPIPGWPYDNLEFSSVYTNGKLDPNEGVVLTIGTPERGYKTRVELDTGDVFDLYYALKQIVEAADEHD